MKLIVCRVFFLLGFALSSIGATPDPKIRTELLKNYDRMALPNYTPNRKLDSPSFVTVTIIELMPTHFMINEQDQTFELTAAIHLSWLDNRLKRNSNETNKEAKDRSYLHFQPDEIWVPDITLYDSASPLDFETYGKRQCLVHSSGKVMWVPEAMFVAYCDLNLRKWPKDTQECTVKLGSWTYHEEELDMRFEHNLEVDASWNKKDAEWEVIDTRAGRESTKRECCLGSYPSVEYTFTLQRRSTLHTYTIIVPLVLISIVNLVQFVLSPRSGVRVTLGAINFLVICIYLIFFRVRLPELDHVPYVVILYLCNLVVVSLSICSVSVLSCMGRIHRNRFSPVRVCPENCDNL